MSEMQWLPVVLDTVSEFGCRNDSGRSINLQALHWATPQGTIVGYYELGFLECFCCVEKRIMVIGENGRCFRVIFQNM